VANHVATEPLVRSEPHTALLACVPFRTPPISRRRRNELLVDGCSWRRRGM
jgi:hypothetical protein